MAKLVKSLVNYAIGAGGVNVDESNLHMDDTELRKAQNAIKDPLVSDGAINNRPGLINFNSAVAAGAVLGGIGVPLLNMVTGSHFFYIGRGTQ